MHKLEITATVTAIMGIIVSNFSTQAWARLPEVKVGIVFLFDYWTPAE